MKKFLCLILLVLMVFQSYGVSSFNAIQNQVSITVEKLNINECKKLFKGRNTIYGSDPVYPLRLTFGNQSDKVWNFNNDNISLKLATSQEVLDKVNSYSFVRRLGCVFLMFGSVLSGVGALGTIALIPFMAAEVGVGIVGAAAYLAGGVVVQAGFAYGLYLGAKAIEVIQVKYDNSIIIGKGIGDIIIFVKNNDFKNNFKLQLSNYANSDEKLEFQVRL